jgi:hypothetical protein
MSISADNNPAALLPEVINLCLESLEEVKKAYSEAKSLRTRVVELEKVASEKSASAVDESLVKQTVRNLVASSFLDAEHSEKLAADMMKDPTVAVKLVQRFIEISAPPFSEGQGVAKAASSDNSLADPDGWARVLSKGA